MQHGTAPDERLVSRIEEADRNHFEAVRVDGRDSTFVLHLGLLVGAEHERNVGTVNIGVEQADAETHFAEGESEIDGQRGFTDSTFAGADGDDGFDAGQGLRGRWLLARMGVSAHEVLFSERRGVCADTLIIR